MVWIIRQILKRTKLSRFEQGRPRLAIPRQTGSSKPPASTERCRLLWCRQADAGRYSVPGRNRAAATRQYTAE